MEQKKHRGIRTGKREDVFAPDDLNDAARKKRSESCDGQHEKKHKRALRSCHVDTNCGKKFGNEGRYKSSVSQMRRNIIVCHVPHAVRVRTEMQIQHQTACEKNNKHVDEEENKPFPMKHLFFHGLSPPLSKQLESEPRGDVFENIPEADAAVLIQRQRRIGKAV